MIEATRKVDQSQHIEAQIQKQAEVEVERQTAQVEGQTIVKTQIPILPINVPPITSKEARELFVNSSLYKFRAP